MNSIAILYSMKKSDAPRDEKMGSAELHINYWKIPASSGCYTRFIDFGVMINDVAPDIDKVYFYFPFTFEDTNLEDLGAQLRESSFLCTLFNGDYIIKNLPNSPSYSEVSSQDSGRNPFLLYELGKSNFSLTSMAPNKGMLLSIAIKAFPVTTSNQPKNVENKGRNLYFRFRLNYIPKEVLCHEEEVSNDFFQSAFSKCEMLSFRINDKRELDKKVYEDISAKGVFTGFNKIHFFFIGSSEDERVDGNSTYCDCRLLDSERWKPYLKGKDLKNRKCLAYHWSYKAESDETLDKCNIFLRTVYKSLNKRKLLKYCSVVILLGAIGSLLPDIVIIIFKVIVFLAQLIVN